MRRHAGYSDDIGPRDTQTLRRSQHGRYGIRPLAEDMGGSVRYGGIALHDYMQVILIAFRRIIA